MGRAFIGVVAFEITLRDETVLGIFFNDRNYSQLKIEDFLD